MQQATTKIGGILSLLFRTISHNLNADNPARQERLVENYLSDPKNNIDQNQHARTSARGNLRKDLVSDAITMKTFIKLLAYLRIVKFRIIIEIPHANGKITQHSVTVDTSNENGINADDELTDTDS